jgi:alcohol dehydrogenase (cytochrome c)
MLIDATYRSQERKLLVQANRNGYLYVLDRTDGKFLFATPFVEKLIWEQEISPGWTRPLVRRNYDYGKWLGVLWRRCRIV